MKPSIHEETADAQQPPVFHANCSSRLLLDQIADKWSILVIAALCASPTRFNVIRRRLEGITQKSLTQTLRRLERNGMIARRVITDSPIAVEYSITPLGQSLKAPFQMLYAWTEQHKQQVEQAQQAFDQRTTQTESA
jgi:DNA-binding HxlR family transcriptional regulator